MFIGKTLLRRKSWLLIRTRRSTRREKKNTTVYISMSN